MSESKDQASPASTPSLTELNLRLTAAENTISEMAKTDVSALASRLKDLETATASYIAPKLGAVEHDAHAAAQSWLSKMLHLFAKPAGVPPGEPPTPTAAPSASASASSPASPPPPA